MDEPVLTMDVTRLRAEPGGQAQLSVKVRNPGHLVESFHMDVVGLDPTWWQVHPPELAVYPGKEESAIVLLSPPPNAQAPDDALPFGVRAVSTLDAQRSVVEEGDLEVGRVFDLQASMSPVTSKGRWVGRHKITYLNWGNSPIHLRLSVEDKDEELGFRLEPEQVSVPIGGSAIARLRVRPRNPFLRGQPVRRQFQVVGESAGAAPEPGTPRPAAVRAGVPDPGRPVLDGAMLHLPILSKGVVALAALLLAAIVGLVVLSKTVHVVGAHTPDARLDPPTQLVAEGVTANLIHLRWAPSDRADLYRVQKLDDTGNVTDNIEVKDGATAADAKVDQPLTSACYQVVAARGTNVSSPSEKQCATSRDGRLPAPTNVTATEAPGGCAVGWSDNDQNNGHTVLVDGAPVGNPSPAGVKNVTVPVPAGQHRIAVVATQGTSLSSAPSTEVVCTVTAAAASNPPTAPPQGGAVVPPGGGATPSGVVPPGGGGTPTGVVPPGGGTPTGGVVPPGGGSTPTLSVTSLGPFAAEIGPPYQEQGLGETILKQVQVIAPMAQLVPVTQLPQLGFVSGFVIVVPNFQSAENVQQFCAVPHANFPPGCVGVAIPA